MPLAIGWHPQLLKAQQFIHNNKIAMLLGGMGDTYQYIDNNDTDITIAITILYFVYRDNH